MNEIKQTGKVSREDMVRILVQEGHIMFIGYKSVEDIPNATLLDAQYNVIVELGKQKGILIDRLADQGNIVSQFYAAAQRANVLVKRDDQGKIKFEVL